MEMYKDDNLNTTARPFRSVKCLQLSGVATKPHALFEYNVVITSYHHAAAEVAHMGQFRENLAKYKKTKRVLQKGERSPKRPSLALMLV
ncbi:hypothetical protein PG993_013523 [Apiospora rasikravindrae]|uniref:Uncharacterized protein n=1 Tax=Apiospora rasikravindrae TaxID=990691 RepID=A0ABR1RXW1_9PEZI